MSRVRHYLIEGLVQGVGFRNFTEIVADELGVLGWVRNLVDGRVEVLAQGDDSQLTEFLKLLNRGPTRARVDRVVEHDVSSAKKFRDFSVAKTGEIPWSEN